MSPKKIPPHRTLFDDLPDKCIFCNRDDLTNEASVEQFFINRLLNDLGYKDNQIKPKTSISEILVSRGSKRINYKPDYVLTYRRSPRWIIDAKAPTEDLDKWVGQCSSYCLELNQHYDDRNPVEFFLLSNGLITNLYRWDSNTPLLELRLEDFNPGNPIYEKLRFLLVASKLSQEAEDRIQSVETHDFEFIRPTPEKAKNIFSQCHDYIWKADKRSPSSAFMEFIKVMFVKLWADRELRNDPAIARLLEHSNKLPASAVSFSVQWIESRENEITNPINDIHFIRLRERIEEEISREQKKRLFDKGEEIRLKRETIKEVVRRLEHYDMYGIDEDLNGRLFETFLSAIMRGQALGQFFTPRSIVKLMVLMANLEANDTKISYVLDACCGSGGFLIEALAIMREKIRNNKSLSTERRDELIDELSNHHLYGIDAGVDPEIVRIARINMYLHGDGGSKIYFADSLDKNLISDESGKREDRLDREELKEALEKDLLFDVVLTNPPFAMRYEASNLGEKRILEQYDIARVDPNTSELKPSLRSSAMFIERYRDLLRPGGMLLTVIDDTILSSQEHSSVRDYIRKCFIIKGVVSLHGDAFQRAGARAKTSILYLEKKRRLNEEQPDTFMDFSIYLGVDDLTAHATITEIEEARSKAEEEIDRILSNLRDYKAGKQEPWLVPAHRLTDRLDAKHCVPQQGRFASQWREDGFPVNPLNEFVELVSDEFSPQDYPDKDFRIMRVQYDGECIYYETLKGKDIKYKTMQIVHEWDLVFSNIGAVMGSIGIVPRDLGGCIVSSEYTILRAANQIDTVYLWSVLRSSELRSDLLSTASGISRHRIKWPNIGVVKVPVLPEEDRKEIYENYMQAYKLIERAEKSLREIRSLVDYKLNVESDESKRRFESTKPPR